jgi:hypothetical protein
MLTNLPDTTDEKLSDLLVHPDVSTKKELKISIDPDSVNQKDHIVTGLTGMDPQIIYIPLLLFVAP